MGLSITKDELKRLFKELITSDPEFSLMIKGALVESFATKEDIKNILTEIKNLREDFKKHVEIIEKRMDQFEERINQFERKMDQFEERMNQFEKRMEELRVDFNEGMKRLDLKISALGARWGLYSELSIRNVFEDILEGYLGAKVDRWEAYDEEGVVYGYPSMVEADLVIKDGKHILIEMKSHVRKSDVAELLRLSEVYEKVEGVKPELVIVSPFVEERAVEFAKIKNIKVYTYEDLKS
ncbi:MAG: PD-(D/E)XK nuclease family protein [Candidatus Njordarchaeia archaeon]